VAVAPAKTFGEKPNSEEAMMAALGIPGGFNSTKGQHVVGNEAGSTKVLPKIKYRQYMNRKPGYKGKKD